MDSSWEWKRIFANEKYEACEFDGLIRNTKTGKILNARVKRNGYKYVKLTCKYRKTREYLVHRLVCTAFKKGRHKGNYVNHKDYNRLNNDAYNVEWSTKSENELHKWKRINENRRKSNGKGRR